MGFANGPKGVIDRFTAPVIDDPALPISDALVAQIVAPSLEVFWLTSNHASMPTWLTMSQSLFPMRGSLVAPTLIHGAMLASCWIAGALAAKAFEVDAFDVSEGKGYGNVFLRTIQAGAFATGLLIFVTQLDLLLEFGQVVHYGEGNEEVDIRLLQSAVELINDVVFEASVLLSWRLVHAKLLSAWK